MYDEFKEEYLDTITTDSLRKQTKNFLRELVDVEEKTRCSVLESDMDEIYKIISSSGYYNLNTLRNYVAMIKKFLLYMIKTHPDVIKNTTWDQVMELKPREADLVSIIKKSLFKSFEEVKPCFSEMNVDFGYYDEVLYALIWSGFSIQQIATIKDEDVLPIPKVVTGSDGVPREVYTAYIRYDGEFVQVTDDCASQVILDWKKKCESKSYWSGTDMYPIDDGIFLKRIWKPSDKHSNRKLTANRIDRRKLEIEQHKNAYRLKLGKRVVVTTVRDSGLYQRLHEREKAYGKLDDADIIKIFGELSGKYILDRRQVYECYKIAFDLQ